MADTPTGIVIDWQAGTVRVSASYALKVQLENVDFGMEDAHTSFSYEIPIPASVTDAATLALVLVDLHSTIKDGAKLATMSELDVAHLTTDDGVIRPVITVPGIPVASLVPAAPAPTVVESPTQQPVAPAVPAVQAAPVVPATPAGGGNIIADFGFGELEYYDNRPKKVAGQYKPNAADFKSLHPVPGNNNQQHAVWLTFPNGGANQEMVNAAQAYGLV